MAKTLLHFTDAFTPPSPFFTGGSTTQLVPDIFPIAINGRPFLVDQKSNQFTRGFEPRVRDSVDQSTSPGEAAINPQGLWRRGENSWHYGAGQKYADTAEAQDYRFFSSKGINPWVKGQVTLLNTVKKSLGSSNTNLLLAVTDTRVYVADGQTLKYTTDPYTSTTATVTGVSASAGTVTYTAAAHGFTAGQVVDITGIVPVAYNLSGATIATVATNTFTVTNGATGTFVSGGTAIQRPIWVSATGLPTGHTPRDMATDGTNIYLTYEGTSNTHGLWKYTAAGVASNVAYGHQLYYVDFVKGHLMVSGDASGGYATDLYYDPAGNIGGDDYTHPVATWNWVSFAAGQNAIYAAGYAGTRGAIYKITITSAGVLDQPVVALELPSGEIPLVVYGYLGGIFIGTNKGVRYATSDSASNLVSGALIPTTGDVVSFTADERYVWFNWSLYDTTTTGLGRIDLSTFISANTPAHASDLMLTSTANVLSAATFNKKRIFSVTGDGVYVEDSANLVTTAELVTGTYRWGIPDRKFVAKFDIRSTPLLGTITPSISLDSGTYTAMVGHTVATTTESVATAPQDKFIEASFKLTFARASATSGPTLTRWMARAYASPARSQVFRVPILMHHRLRIHDTEYYFDVETELQALRDLVTNPRVINYQENTETYSVVMEDLEFQVIDGYQSNWDLEGTCTVTMRSVQD